VEADQLELALDEIAEKLGAIKKEYGSEALLVIGGTQHGVADWASGASQTSSEPPTSSTRQELRRG